LQAADGSGGTVLVSVPVGRMDTAVDDGALFDSTLVP
jgi:hypothetical protein